MTSASSPELGRILHLRVRGRESVVLNLPVTLQKESAVTLVINYSGRLRA